MKVLSPAVTCLLTSHMKPVLGEAIGSVLAQTRLDLQLLVVDSGQWIGRDDDISQALTACHDRYSGHPLIEWVTTGEQPGLPQRRCPVAWAANEAIRAGLIRGRYMCTFYDDDLYRPAFMEEMAGYLDGHPDAGAVWCSQNRVSLQRDGSAVFAGQIIADAPRQPGTWDCMVDGAQVMWRTEMLDKIGDPWLPEDPGDTCRHSDGIFLNRLGDACGAVPNIFSVLVEHRSTPWSTYSPSGG